MSLVEKLFGSFSDRELKKVNPIVKQVLALESKYAALSDAELPVSYTHLDVYKRQAYGSRPVSFTTDCICGFPGETPEDFAESCDFQMCIRDSPGGTLQQGPV